MTIFYTADQHLGHRNIIASCRRPFRDVREMDEALLAGMDRVKEKDLLIVVGDLMFCCKDPEAYLRRLPRCRKILVTGNHDRAWMGRTDPEAYFEKVVSVLTLEDGGRRVLVCHDPALGITLQPEDMWLVYAHLHNNAGGPQWPKLRSMERVLNAGVDVNGWRPVTFEELLENNRAFKAAHPGPEDKEGAP